MKEIALTQNKVTLVDDADFEWLNQYKWHAVYNSTSRRYYAKTKSQGMVVFMHRLILNTEFGEESDHKDRDGLNNQRYNLRRCTVTQNHANRGLMGNNKVGFKGVQKAGKHWRARIYINVVEVRLGCFTTPVLAALAYDAAALRYYGEFACTNKMLGLL